MPGGGGGYRSHEPMHIGPGRFAGARAHDPPQYAEFDAHRKGGEDSLPAMPSWETAETKKVLVEDDPVELNQLKKPESALPLMSGGASGPSSPMHGINPTQPYDPLNPSSNAPGPYARSDVGPYGQQSGVTMGNNGYPQSDTGAYGGRDHMNDGYRGSGASAGPYGRPSNDLGYGAAAGGLAAGGMAAGAMGRRSPHSDYSQGYGGQGAGGAYSPDRSRSPNVPYGNAPDRSRSPQMPYGGAGPSRDYSRSPVAAGMNPAYDRRSPGPQAGGYRGVEPAARRSPAPPQIMSPAGYDYDNPSYQQQQQQSSGYGSGSQWGQQGGQSSRQYSTDTTEPLGGRGSGGNPPYPQQPQHPNDPYESGLSNNSGFDFNSGYSRPQTSGASSPTPQQQQQPQAPQVQPAPAPRQRYGNAYRKPSQGQGGYRAYQPDSQW